LIISFAWTTPALVLAQKDTTRRDWKPRTIAAARKVMTAGELVEAWSISPMYAGAGGAKVADIRITEIIEDEDSSTMSDDEWEREGFHVLEALGAKIDGSSPLDVFRFWRLENVQPQTVVRFELIRLTPKGEAERARLERMAIQPFALPPGWDK